ncbi:hypothetical protein ACE6H2_024403 [Prunus campanulata]
MSIEVGSLDQNCKHMKVNLDLLEEERRRPLFELQLTSLPAVAHILLQQEGHSYQQQLTSYYKKKAIVRVAAYQLDSIAGKLLLEYKLNGAFFKRYVPDIRPQATSLTSTEGKLLI